MRILLAIVSLLCFLSCKNNYTVFEVTGSTREMDGTIAILKQGNIAYDTAVVSNNKFSLSGRLIDQELCEISFSGKYPENSIADYWRSTVDIFVEKGAFYKLTINTSDDLLQRRFELLSSSKHQQGFTDFRISAQKARTNLAKHIKELEIKRTIFLNKGLMDAYSDYTDSIRIAETSYPNVYFHVVKIYLRNHPNTYQSLQLLKRASDLYNNLDFYMSVYHSLTPEFRNKQDAKDFIYRVNQLNKMNVRGFTVQFVAAARNGQKFNIADYSDSKMIIIDLWASWCTTCVGEMPDANKMKEKFSFQKVAYIFLSLDENQMSWKNIDSALNLKDSYLIDPSRNKSFKRELDVHFLPRYVIINNKGELIHKNAPRPSQPELQILVNKLLKQMEGIYLK